MTAPTPLTASQMLVSVQRALGYFPSAMADSRAALLLLATALQETGGSTRVQINGPARGLSQLQLNYIEDIAVNPASREKFIAFCGALGVPFAPRALYGRLTSNDELNFGLDRLGYWCVPSPLPQVGDSDGAWTYYLECHKPGAPDVGRWTQSSYPVALIALKAA